MAINTEEQKQQVIKAYQEGNPTPKNSVELVKKIAADIGETANGVRIVLMKAGVYQKKEESAPAAAKTASGETGTKRVSKESQIEALKEAITKLGAEVDEDILGKLTGKAATYFVSILEKAN